jgi:uncharacterized protein YgiM (DUF1202 family)
VTAASAAALGGACQPKRAARPAPVRVDTIVRTVMARDPELEERVARLELRVLERTAQVEQLEGQLDEARREVVRALAKLQTVANRAEAASGMAEAELALQTLQKAAPQLAEAGQARQLLAGSNEEFGRENYGGALYLATQAKSVVSSGQTRLASGTNHDAPREGEVVFALPLRLQTLGRSNVRDGPGTNYKVLFMLEVGSAVIAYAYADQWVRINDEGGRSGWVFYNLVGRRDGSP